MLDQSVVNRRIEEAEKILDCLQLSQHGFLVKREKMGKLFDLLKEVGITNYYVTTWVAGKNPCKVFSIFLHTRADDWKLIYYIFDPERGIYEREQIFGEG